MIQGARRGQQRAGKTFTIGQRKPVKWKNPRQVVKEKIFDPLWGVGYASCLCFIN